MYRCNVKLIEIEFVILLQENDIYIKSLTVLTAFLQFPGHFFNNNRVMFMFQGVNLLRQAIGCIGFVDGTTGLKDQFPVII